MVSARIQGQLTPLPGSIDNLTLLQCHTHQKVKDTTKRRREVALGRATRVSNASTVKSESREETPFSMESGLTPLHEACEVDNQSQDDAGSCTPGMA